MPETPIGSRITIKTCAAAADVNTATTLLLETSRGARLMLEEGSGENTYDVYEWFGGDSDWVVARDETGAAISITLSSDYGTPLPASLFGAGWLRFVGTPANIIAKAFG